MIQRISCIILSIFLIFSLISCKKEEKVVKTNELVICSFGGSFQDAQRKAFFQPFEKATGIKIREVNYSGEYSKIKAMVQSGNVDWDVVDVELGVLLTGSQEGVYEPIDQKLIIVQGLMEEARHQYAVATDFYSTGIAYREDSKLKIPKTWGDFWNIKQFPGSRSLRKNPYTLLEIALLADGVKPSELYPLDVDRAFKSLDRIKKYVRVWWTTGQQPVQLLSTKEVDFTTAWSGRIWNANHIDNLPLKYNYNQALLESEWWVILKGAKNKENAMKFIIFASQAEQQAEMAKAFGVGPVNKEAFKFLDQNAVSELPTSPENIGKQIFVKGDWWAKNQESISKRWEKWLLE